MRRQRRASLGPLAPSGTDTPEVNSPSLSTDPRCCLHQPLSDIQAVRPEADLRNPTRCGSPQPVRSVRFSPPKWQRRCWCERAAHGVEGNSLSGVGVWGLSQTSEGVHGVAHGAAVGVAGFNLGTGSGVWGEAGTGGGEGVTGRSHSANAGVAGYNIAEDSGPGVWGESKNFDGVHGVSHHPQHAGVAGLNDNGGLAGFFGGRVVVTGTISVSGTDLLGAIKQLGAQIQALEGQITQPASQVLISP